MKKRNKSGQDNQKKQLLKESIKSVLRNCGRNAGEMPCQFYIHKQLEKIDKLHAEIDELKQRIWLYENL